MNITEYRHALYARAARAYDRFPPLVPLVRAGRAAARAIRNGGESIGYEGLADCHDLAAVMRAGSAAGAYCLPPNYMANDDPAYYHCVDTGVRHQPDIYAMAARAARAVGAHVVIDVGCGDGRGVPDLAPSLSIIGLDYGANLERARQSWPEHTWRAVDLDHDLRLPVTDAELDGAVLVCADVIEHLRHPDRLLALLHDALERGARGVLLSTPDREGMRGADNIGPPTNRAHVREWAMAELAAFAWNQGLIHGGIGYIRSEDWSHQMSTLLVIAAPDNAQYRLIRASLGAAERTRA